MRDLYFMEGSLKGYNFCSLFDILIVKHSIKAARLHNYSNRVVQLLLKPLLCFEEHSTSFIRQDPQIFVP